MKLFKTIGVVLLGSIIFSTPSTPIFTEPLSSRIQSLSPDSAPAPEKTCDYQFADGTTIRVHYLDAILERSQAADYFPKEVLDAAVLAYQTITQFQGFATPGYSFAAPDKNYAYDPDRTIDIYLGDPGDAYPFRFYGFQNMTLRDAPCFDTIKLSDTQYQAVIFLPANYPQFIKAWERINPSPLGSRNTQVDLRGTLVHEMLHVILFYYNKNLSKDRRLGGKGVDWYVEGLARYFETLVGARHDFYSQGFKQMLPDKIRFSRGGSNYFMRYPDQAFTQLRYENALFWRYMDYRYGMGVIEKLSRNLRKSSEPDFKHALEEATGKPLSELLKDFNRSILLKDFGLKADSGYLKEIAKTHLVYKKSDFYITDGHGNEMLLGKTCATDWIGKWEGASAKFGEPAVAGDNTEKSDVAGWATDFYAIEFDGNNGTLPGISISHKGKGRALVAQAMLISKGGSVVIEEIGEIPKSRSHGVRLGSILRREGLTPGDLEKVFLLITNSDPDTSADYEIRLL